MSTNKDAFEGMSKEQLLAVIKAIAKQGAPDITVKEVVSLYLVYMRGRVEHGQLTVEYLHNVARDLEHFARVHGPKLVRDCVQHTLTNFIASNPKWRSAHRQYTISGYVATCFRWAKSQGMIAESPFRRVKVRTPSHIRRPCTGPEYVALMRYANRALRRILLFLRRTGCRTCEARELKWDDVHLDAENPHVTLAKHKSLHATGKPRVFALDKGTVHFLKALKRQAPPGVEYVFFNVDGRKWTRFALALAFRRTRAHAGLPDDIEHRFSAYSLRHLYATAAIKAGMSSKKVADQLGHQTTLMVERIYAASTRADLDHLGRVANEAIRARLRERPCPLVTEKPLDIPPSPPESGRFGAVFFGDKLRGLRRNAGLTQSELADKIGLKTQQIKEFESGRVRPLIETVVRIAEVLGADLAYFHDGEGKGAA